MLGRVADRAGCAVVCAGSPNARDAADCARLLGTEPADDLRALLAGTDVQADGLLLADADGTGDELPAAVAQATARGMRILTLDAVPGSALALSGGGWLRGAPVPAESIRPLSLFSRSGVWRTSPELVADFGSVRFASVQFWSPSQAASLGDRLFDALELVLGVMGECELIDAVIAPVETGPAVHAEPGDALQGLTGRASLNLRFDDGRAASIVAVSVPGAPWQRSVTLSGPAGLLVADDSGIGWIGPEGTELDRTGEPGGGSETEQVLADALKRALENTAAEAPVPYSSVLTLAQAALLSCRTGQSESPEMIQRMVLPA